MPFTNTPPQEIANALEYDVFPHTQTSKCKECTFQVGDYYAIRCRPTVSNVRQSTGEGSMIY